MNGITNAQGAASYNMRGLNSSINSLERRVQTLMSNPPVGSLTLFAGFEWLVVHWDIVNGIMYLALKECYDRVLFHDTANCSSYAESNLKSALSAFEENELLYSVDDAPPEMVRASDGSYAFIPTAEQIKNEFSLFRSAANGKRSFAVAASGGKNRYSWWTSTISVQIQGGLFYPYFVSGSGELLDTAEGTAAYCGLRPFIRVRMRGFEGS